MPSSRDNAVLKRTPALQLLQGTGHPPRMVLTGEWTTLSLAPVAARLRRQLSSHSPGTDTCWILTNVEKLDHTGALLLWQAWGRSTPQNLEVPSSLRPYFARLGSERTSDPAASGAESGKEPVLRRAIELVGRGLFVLIGQLHDAVALMGRVLLDLADLVRHPAHWPAREISAAIFRAGAQATGILALLGFLIGVVLSYLSGDQLRNLGAEQYVVNLLGVGCVRELGPLLAAILVAGRSGSSITAQLGVMRLNEELDALATIGISYSQRLILPKVVALSISQPFAGLWTSAVALAGGMVAAHVSLGVSYRYFLTALPGAVPIANYWIGLGKGAVFGAIIALVASFFGLRVQPNTESLGIGTTNSVVAAISCVLGADALSAVLFAHVG